MDEQMQDSAEPAGWLIEFKNDIGETITRFYTHNAIGDYRASVDANATSTPLYKRAALSQPAAQVDSSHSAGGECGGITQWQPIETAPTLKTVLACNACGYVGGAIKDKAGRWNHIGNPTHWMPFPVAPKATP